MDNANSSFQNPAVTNQESPTCKQRDPSQIIKMSEQGVNKPNHFPPPAFWDNVSKIFLEEGALREFNRRNAESASRHIKSNATQSSQLIPAATYLSRISNAEFGQLKRFSRHGGPDISKEVCGSTFCHYVPDC